MEDVTISIIIPALNERHTIGECIRSALAGDPLEVIVVDGGSTDGTVDFVTGMEDVTLVRSVKRGRAAQMNEGVRISRGDVLLFLHADTLLPRGWKEAVRNRFRSKSGCAGGCFLVTLTGKSPILRLTEAMINLRTHLTGSFTGDQAMFVRRDFFFKIGGFPDVPIMEDLILADRIRRAGASIVREKVLTSSRRWETWGPVRTIFLMWYTKLLFRLGSDPEDLAVYYLQGKFPKVRIRRGL